MNAEVLSQLLNYARETLEASPKTPFSQAIVLKTVKGNTYSFYMPSFAEQPEAFGAMEDRIVATLRDREDTAAACLLAMWADGSVDLPSYSFREKLIALDPRNREALLPLMSMEAEGAYVVRSIGSCMPEK